MEDALELLRGYDVVVLDEVHERHLSTDCLLALLRAVLLQVSPGCWCPAASLSE